MYYVYKITNLVNNKTYIGSSSISRGYETRWKEHQQNARLKSRLAYNYPISQAIRKYGLSNFIFEIIVDNIQTPEERWKIEKEEIIKNHSLTSEKGYNQTLNTEYSFDDPLVRKKHATPVCGINIKNPEDKIFFTTITEAANFIGSDRNSIHHCINGDKRYSYVKGYIWRKYNLDTLEIIENNIPIQQVLNKYITINGISKTFVEWCEYFGISKQSVYLRIKKGMSVEKALSTPKRR